MISTQRYCLFFPLVLCITAITFPAAAHFHSADTNRDNKIDLSELLRVIQFYNSDGYHCVHGTEDSYDPGSGDRTCTPHDSDYNPQDWHIGLSELLRLIQFYNLGGYRISADTEDGFLAGLTVFFVNKDSPALPEQQNGLSWVTAFSDLQPAIDALYHAGGGELWVAAGVYNEVRETYPHGNEGDSSWNTGSVILRSGVHLYGGF